MFAQAKDISWANPVLEYGVVRQATENVFTVAGASTVLTAGRAFSCLVRPEPGDTVLVAVEDTGRSRIIAVMDRPGQAPGARLDLEGNLEVNVNQGSLRFRADTDLSLSAGEELSLTSQTIAADADEGRFRLKHLSFLGHAIDTQVQRIRTVAETCDHYIRTWTQRLVSSFRSVSDHDEVQANSKRTLVDGVLTMQARTAVMTAEEDVKIDAEQIHLG